MAKQIEKVDALKQLEKAKSIREQAEKQAKEIESGILQELKDQRKNLLEQVKQLDSDIERISGKTIAVVAVTGKKNKKPEPVILEILKDSPKLSCAGIQSHSKMKALYDGGQVSPQANKLAKMVEEKKLKKEGEGKTAVYSLA